MVTFESENRTFAVYFLNVSDFKSNPSLVNNILQMSSCPTSNKNVLNICLNVNAYLCFCIFVFVELPFSFPISKSLMGENWKSRNGKEKTQFAQNTPVSTQNHLYLSNIYFHFKIAIEKSKMEKIKPQFAL